MLTGHRAATLRRPLAAALLVALVTALGVLVALGSTVTAAAPAAAAPPSCDGILVPVTDPTGTVHYICTHNGGGGPGGGGGGGGGAPSCALLPPSTFCMGTSSCWYEPWHPPYVLPPGPQPPGSQPMVRHCIPVGGGESLDFVWVGGTPVPPLPAQALQAVGAIVPPRGTLAFSPARRAVVGLDTWFWVDGVPAGTLRGSSAFGLVAVATPDRLELDPGDGSGRVTCPWTTSATDARTACSHTYDRASVGGPERVAGQPAYRGEVTAVWTLRFVLDGTPVTIAGAPTEFRAPVWTTPVPVAEIQAVVTQG